MACRAALVRQAVHQHTRATSLHVAVHVGDAAPPAPSPDTRAQRMRQRRRGGLATAVTVLHTECMWLHAAQLSAGGQLCCRGMPGEAGGAAITEASEAYRYPVLPPIPSRPSMHTLTVPRVGGLVPLSIGRSLDSPPSWATHALPHTPIQSYHDCTLRYVLSARAEDIALFSSSAAGDPPTLSSSHPPTLSLPVVATASSCGTSRHERHTSATQQQGRISPGAET
jgi:hypothetical protein